jgi:hypothetical protein
MADEKKRPRVDLGEFGNTGLTRFSGYIYEERLPELQQFQGRKIYREMMDNDPIIAGCLRAIEMLIRQVDWFVQPAGSSPDAQDDAEFVEQCREDMAMTWEDTVAEVLTMLGFGWQLSEKVFKIRSGRSADPAQDSKYSDGRIGWRKFAPRSQETLLHWDFDESGGLRGMVQLPPPDYQIRYIPIAKSLLFRTTSRLNNPEGYSILRGAYTSWYYASNLRKVEAIGIERDLAGLPIAYVPAELLSSTATPNQQAVLAKIKQTVTGVRVDEQMGIVWPMEYDDQGKPLYDFKLLSTGGTRQVNANEVIQRYESRMALSMLASFLLLGSNQHGSWALSSDQTDLFATAIGSILDIIASTFNRFAVPELLLLNGRDISAGTPTLEHGDIEQPNLGELGMYIQQLSQAGFPLFPSADGSLEKRLMQVASLPEPPDEGYSPLPNRQAQTIGGQGSTEEEDSA